MPQLRIGIYPLQNVGGCSGHVEAKLSVRLTNATVTFLRPGLRAAQGSRWTGRHRIGFDAREGAPFVEYRPCDAGELVGECNGEHVVVQSLLRRLDPRFEPIALP